MKKIFISLTFSLSIIATTIAQSTQPWNGKKCAVVLTYDDAIPQQLDNAIPVLDSLGLKATFYITAYFARERLDDWKKVAAKGYELGNHTLFHPCAGGKGREWVKAEYNMNNYTVQRMIDEIRMTNIFLHELDARPDGSVGRGGKMQTTMKWLNDAISGIAVILLIITAGGVLKQVIQDSGAGNYISSFSSKLQMPPLLFAWVVTALLRVTIGSATVAGMTAAGVLSPLIATTNVSPELMVLAVGTGSVFGSHINDSGFWMFKEFFNLSLKQTFLSWTIMETTISVLGLIGVLILQMFVS